jgi:hypothetical protein
LWANWGWRNPLPKFWSCQEFGRACGGINQT